ncbi:MAG: hypothetical protein OZSIB_3713 [Candidatus Ozemobacter sibiricus]|uniref:Uncharacterized protein n=1 Tax=Candidatus Ozemobacter sibiricus TaxID=2268124 RepID=A0A367ZCD7_9BACT|nr:MAG: hypothetical protein OZSIB_3713 [Candidatus Ozemobacter sibiricus]
MNPPHHLKNDFPLLDSKIERRKGFSFPRYFPFPLGKRRSFNPA